MARSWTIVLAVAAITGACTSSSSAPTTPLPYSPSPTAYSSSPTAYSSSPTPEPEPLTQQEVAALVASAVQANSPTHVQWGIAQPGDVTIGNPKQLTPSLLFKFGDAPKSFNWWRAMEQPIIDYRDQLARAGIKTYGTATVYKSGVACAAVDIYGAGRHGQLEILFVHSVRVWHSA